MNKKALRQQYINLCILSAKMIFRCQENPRLQKNIMAIKKELKKKLGELQ